MKLVGIVGSNSDQSYNRLLMKYIAVHNADLFDLEILDTKDIPLFNQSNDQTDSGPVQFMKRKIEQADGVIIATPEHNHTVPANLKSLIEWLSFKIHPLDNKPVLIIGASYYDQGSSRAQLHLRQIMEAPGVNAIVMPGNEFLLAEVKQAFDEQGEIKDPKTSEFLQVTLRKFVKFVQVAKALEEPKPLPEEDLNATGKIATTIADVDMRAADWVEQAAKKTQAVSGDTYVQLDRGILTVDQINYLLSSMPMELTYADSNNEFLYYNAGKEQAGTLAGRTPDQVGNPLIVCHPAKALKNVEWVIQQLRAGKQDVIRIHVPKHGPDKYVVHSYQAMHDEQQRYVGLNEYVMDIKPVIDWYLQQTKQQLVATTTTTAAVASASVKSAPAANDAVASASVKPTAPAATPTEPAGVASASVKP